MMNRLNEKLERVASLAASGSELERDLALELLRGIYAELKFGTTDGEYPAAEDCDVAAEMAAGFGAAEAVVEPAVAAVEEPISAEPVVVEPEYDLIGELISDLTPETVSVPVSVSEPAATPVPEPMSVMSARRVSPDVIRSLYGSDDDEPQAPRHIPEPSHAPVPEPAPEPAPELRREPENEPEAAPERDAVRESTPAPEPIREPEPEPVREYSPAPEPASVPEPAPAPVPTPAPAPLPEPVPAPERTYSQPRPAQEPAQSQLQPATIGDTIGAGHTTLGESLRSGERDVATRAAAAEKPGLRRSIGLNDRFLMIRDMFGGDAAAFDVAIERLDAFTDLDDAVIWMRSNFDWSADSPGAAMLVTLLERKLGR